MGQTLFSLFPIFDIFLPKVPSVEISPIQDLECSHKWLTSSSGSSQEVGLAQVLGWGRGEETTKQMLPLPDSP